LPVNMSSPLPFTGNSQYLDQMYRIWKEDPDSLDEKWKFFFQGFDLAMCPRTCESSSQAHLQSKVASLIYAYRDQGHLLARLDPLGNNVDHHPDLELRRFDLKAEDLDKTFDTGHLFALKRAPLRDIISTLKKIYCENIGVEFLHIQDVKQRRWIQSKIEPILSKPEFSKDEKLEILELLVDSDVFEKFLQKRYPGQKRFSLEGAESFIPAFHSMVDLAPELGIEELVVGMAHRGRLNVLANILDKPYSMIFSEFEGNFIAESVGGDGDVKYHKGFSSNHINKNNLKLHLTLASNPSHLEAVGSVVEGKVRAKQRKKNDTEKREKVVPMLVHGDAAFAGQGMVAETLNLSQLAGYRTGGTVHVIINNQIGFTTLPRDSRSTRYSTDIAKMIEAPIFHVNGDDPEACVFVAKLALEFRQIFKKDVVVDIICYRRHGHNEGDEPAFTQPILYKKIKNHRSVRKIYLSHMMECCPEFQKKEHELTANYQDKLQQAMDFVREKNPEVAVHTMTEEWKGMGAKYSHDPVDTSVSKSRLIEIAKALTTLPDGFRLNPKVDRKLKEHFEHVKEDGAIDWGFAELLAYGSLLMENNPVRLSGQDSERGTFSHRHSVWRDMETQEAYTPLNHIDKDQARFCVHNSSLSEAGILGFEYGYSLVDPRMLIIWEAQFGDFANGAQVIIDQFISSSQSKWQRTSGLVMLLPHGYEGQGPEHSSAYLERYLQACAEENIQVCNLTTTAQYFHMLRRQIKRPFRRPLILMSPKSLLRNPLAASSVNDLEKGSFQTVIQDPNPPPRTSRLVLCSGKVYYDLYERRERDGREGTAIVRIEQLYPFDKSSFLDVIKRHKSAEEIVWAQEESKNRGGWCYISRVLKDIFPEKEIRYIGRKPSASPATGSIRIHKREQVRLVRDAVIRELDEGDAV